MNLPSPQQFKADDFPELPVRFLELLSRSLRVLSEVLVRVPERAEALNRFVTADSSGLATLELGNELPQSPKHVKVTLVRDDTDPDTAVGWCFTWRVVSDDVIRISFGGLTSSRKYRINVEYN